MTKVTVSSGTSIRRNSRLQPATQSEVNAGTGSGYVTPITLAAYTDPARVQSVVSAATVTPNADSDDAVKITAQAEALILANPSGTPTEMQGIVIRIEGTGIPRAITYGNKYRVIGNTLPVFTLVSKIIYIAICYNLTDDMWDVVGIREEL